MSFVVADELQIVGVFQQNGLEMIKPGTSAKLVFSNAPGKVYDTKVLEIARGVGQGQVAASGALARVGSVGLTDEYPARLDIPQGINRDLLRPGMSGTATVFAPNAGVIGIISTIVSGSAPSRRICKWGWPRHGRYRRDSVAKLGCALRAGWLVSFWSSACAAFPLRELGHRRHQRLTGRLRRTSSGCWRSTAEELGKPPQVLRGCGE